MNDSRSCDQLAQDLAREKNNECSSGEEEEEEGEQQSGDDYSSEEEEFFPEKIPEKIWKTGMTLYRLKAKRLILPPNLKVLGVTSPEYGDGSSEVTCEPSDSESNVSGDWEEPLLDESSEVDDLFETDSDESGDWEEEGSEVDEFHSVSDENVDRDDPLLDEGAEVGNRSHSDSFESRDDESS
ncbi:hypothetical protein Tco_0637476 [Tanacetum coccineum]